MKIELQELRRDNNCLSEKNEKLLKQLYSDLNLTYHTKVSSNEELKKIEHDIFKSVNNMS